MIKQTWHINFEEKLRILNLHESATKNQYLIIEQEGEVTYKMCTLIFYKRGDDFFIKNPETGQFDPLTKLSDIKAILRQSTNKGEYNVAFDMDSPTGLALDLGEVLNMNCRPQFEKPNSRITPYSDIVVYDDIKYKVPVWGALTTTNSNIAINADTLKNIKEKDGAVIEMGKTRTNNFALGMIPLMIAQPKQLSGKIELLPPSTETTTELNLESPFVFDKTDLTPEAEKAFVDFLQNLKTNIDKYSGDVIVTTSASIDGKGKEDYDLNLSKRRAETIIKRLKSMLGDTKLNFIPDAIGQTEKYAPGKKFPKSNTEETSPNRRLIIKLPSLK